MDERGGARKTGAKIHPRLLLSPTVLPSGLGSGEVLGGRLRCLLCECKDLSVSSRSTCKKLGMVGYVCYSSGWRWRHGRFPGLSGQPM